MKESSREVRRLLVKSIFPQGVPQLWCPTLTHFSSAGVVDEGRTEAHLDHLRHHVRGILVPGTTGEGWEMKDDETRRLLEIILPLASQGKFQVLIGVLKTDIESTRQTILDTIAWLKKRADESDYLSALKASHVTGFTICPPQGENPFAIRYPGWFVVRIGVGFPDICLPVAPGDGKRNESGNCATACRRASQFLPFQRQQWTG